MDYIKKRNGMASLLANMHVITLIFGIDFQMKNYTSQRERELNGMDCAGVLLDIEERISK